MSAVCTKVARLSFACLAGALLLGACARPVDMSLASLYQRPPEFDFLLYQDAWACISEGGPVRDADGRSCSPDRGRQLRELFAQQSASRSLHDYLIHNGASCRTSANVVTCGYTRTMTEPPAGFGRLTSSGEEGVELTVSFPANDIGLTPQQIRTALRRFMRPNG